MEALVLPALSNMKLTLEGIQQSLKEYGWNVISTSYKNLNEEMEFQCENGHSVFTPYKKIRDRKPLCPICEKNNYKLIQEDKTVIPKGKTKRLLALDQATKITGYSIFEGNKLIKYGVYKADATLNEIERIISIKQWFISLLKNWEIDYVALEGIQYQKEAGVVTFETLAHLQGVLSVTAQEEGIPWKICHTAVWREYCGVKGRARADKKKSMQLLVKQWYDVNVTDDCADAIGIGKYAQSKFFPKKWGEN